MILVDIYVPSLNESYDFRLDESVSIDSLTKEIREMLEKMNKSQGEGGRGDFLLCSYEYQSILPKQKTLSECGIHNGSRLLLV